MANDALRPGIALALSGGGFRATLFHMGTLIRLNELGYLAQLDRISAVSGGSITAGMLACRWETLKSRGFAAAELDWLVTQPLRKFCARNIDARAIAEGTISPWSSISEVLAREYDELFEHTRLPELPEKPRTVFNTTNLQTGRDCRISKRYLADYRVGQIKDPDLSVATAVAASSAFPPVLSPCIIEVDPAKWERLDGADLFDDPRYKHTLTLTDGGAYDNIGLEPVDEFETLFVSDAGAPFASWTGLRPIQWASLRARSTLRPIRPAGCAPATSSSLQTCAVRRWPTGASTRSMTNTVPPTSCGAVRQRSTA
jgi:NTE family protein